MKLFNILFILMLTLSCSFDNKTGIWKNESDKFKDENTLFADFKTLSTEDSAFDKIIPLDKNFKFKVSNQKNNFEWKDIFYSSTNNLENLKYNNINKLIYKSKKLSKYKINEDFLFEKNNVILSDVKGNIIIFSVNDGKVISKFNFYKKKYKKIKIKLNLIVENNIIYTSDNIGYLYAYDYKKKKILWAKNYKIPFRSNFKIFENKLITSNQNNNLFFFNKLNGDTLKLIPTEETVLKNKFINNLAINNKQTFFLNTFGSMYSLDSKTMTINWFLNLNKSIDINPSNLFNGDSIVISENKIIVPSNQSTYILDVNTGRTFFKLNFTPLVKPVIMNNNLFLITKNNLLTATDLDDGNIIYSYDINEKIAEFLNTKKKLVQIKHLMIINDQIFIFLKNSYILKLNINGNLEEINKLPSKLNTNPIFINKSILYLDYKNKLSIVD